MGRSGGGQLVEAQYPSYVCGLREIEGLGIQGEAEASVERKVARAR